jgi:hypothetical protein
MRGGNREDERERLRLAHRAVWLTRAGAQSHYD